MKKWLAFMTAGILLFAAAGCANGGGDDADSAAPSGESGANIAFIIPADDALGINDRGWIQMTWTGVTTYGDANGKTYTWYKPLDNSTQGYYDAMTTAINDGTEVIISLGAQPVEAVVQAQGDYPDTRFIAVEPSGIEAYPADNTNIQLNG